jgi:hypothetical protein
LFILDPDFFHLVFRISDPRFNHNRKGSGENDYR